MSPPACRKSRPRLGRSGWIWVGIALDTSGGKAGGCCTKRIKLEAIDVLRTMIQR